MLATSGNSSFHNRPIPLTRPDDWEWRGIVVGDHYSRAGRKSLIHVPFRPDSFSKVLKLEMKLLTTAHLIIIAISFACFSARSCRNGACVDANSLCDFSDDCGDNSDEQSCSNYFARCTFENDLCDWIQEKDDEIDWIRNKGQTPSFSTGPSRDHTLGTVEGG